MQETYTKDNNINLWTLRQTSIQQSKLWDSQIPDPTGRDSFNCPTDLITAQTKYTAVIPAVQPIAYMIGGRWADLP